MGLEATGLTPLLQVFDMPDAIAFYRDTLGFELVASSPEIEAPEGRYFHWGLLRLGGAYLMLNTAYDAGERPYTPDQPRLEAHRDTGLFFRCPDVDQAYRTLKERAVAVEPPQITPYGMKQIHLVDPDGYAICFQQPV